MTPVQLALTGLELKEQGQQSLERHGWVHDARLAAEGILCQAIEYWGYGATTSDDLHRVMAPPPHNNCVGVVFRDKRFVWTGEWVQSKRPEAHARMIRVWRLSSE
jgi:hypothetical protein